MMSKSVLKITRSDYDSLQNHLFPGDGDEHGAVLLAGLSNTGERLTVFVREIHFAKEGTDYVQGKIGHRALAPAFIHRLITRARDQRLVYLAVHNHASDREVQFSSIDLSSHELGYPALLQIVKGMPVGAVVVGQNSMEVDIWMPNGNRLTLDRAIVIGRSISELTPTIKKSIGLESNVHERQIRMFGTTGQAKLRDAKVGIIGLGGVGSLVAEYLGKLGIGHFLLIDSDFVEKSNISRIVGANLRDADEKTAKVKVAQRLIRECNEIADIRILKGDVAQESTAKTLLNCDYLFLAADSMRARLVVNAIVNQYFIPGVQLGSKIRADTKGNLLEVMSANRPLRPGGGCLWCNQLIDQNMLALEAKSDEERKSQAYGVEEPNPSVISLNAISASHAVNDFILDYLNLRPERAVAYEHFHFLRGTQSTVSLRHDVECTECGRNGPRFAQGVAISLPCREG